ARSIVTLAVSYAREGRGSRVEGRAPEAEPGSVVSGLGGEPVSGNRGQARPPSGVVARYSCYRDYQEVIGERLKSLAGFVNQLGGEGTRSLWYVDTGPLLERDLAQRAGLGFIGKHTNLISRRLGNWVFLAEIITTLELATDQPETNRCGACARCIAA